MPTTWDAGFYDDVLIVTEEEEDGGIHQQIVIPRTDAILWRIARLVTGEEEDERGHR